MEIKVKRTLVKSAPELWELADDLARMESWGSTLVGSASSPVEIRVTDRRPQRMLAWSVSGPGAHARIALEMAEKGFGTAVEITANHEATGQIATDAMERLLDELGSPDRRPFISD
jgi:hypothetical protein